MIPITIIDPEKDDNSTITRIFKVYHKGAGCPLPLVIEVEDLWLTYTESIPNAEQQAAMSESRYYNAINRASLIVRRDLLCLVTEGLLPEDANVLVSPDENRESEGQNILIQTGWLDKINPQVEENDDENTPKGEEVVVNDETGE